MLYSLLALHGIGPLLLAPFSPVLALDPPPGGGFGTGGYRGADGGAGGAGGGGGYGGAGMDDLFKAETNCPAFKCPKGEVPVQKGFSNKTDLPVVYGCDAQTFDMMSMLDPGNPSGLNKVRNSERLWKVGDRGESNLGKVRNSERLWKVGAGWKTFDMVSKSMSRSERSMT